MLASRAVHPLSREHRGNWCQAVGRRWSNAYVVLWPWLVKRERPETPLYASVRIVEAAEFPERTFNPAWEAQNQTRRSEESGAPALPPEEPPCAPALDEGRFYARLQGIVSPALRAKTVLVLGCSASSEMVIRLAKSGLNVRLVDFDYVSVENLCRTAFGVEDLGQPKIEALRRRILDANPFVSVTAVNRNVLDLDEHEVAGLLEGIDLILCATDQLAAQSLGNVWSQQRGIPAVFVGIHGRARGGIVVWSYPRKTPCYRCVMRPRFDAAKEGRADVDLAGERGSAISAALIDAVASLVVMAILEAGESSEFGGVLDATGGRNLIVVRCDPRYRWDDVDIFDVALADLPSFPRDFKAELEREAFFSADTLWLRAAREPDCPDCARYWPADPALAKEPNDA